MRACGFDGVPVEDDLIHIRNRVGILTIELIVRQVDRVVGQRTRPGAVGSRR
jgi:hypothetical protein